MITRRPKPYEKMEKNFLNKCCLYIIILIAISTRSRSEEVNPNFFWPPEEFLIESLQWTENEFQAKWSSYPVYLKLAAFTFASETYSDQFSKIAKRIVTIELDGVDATNPKKMVERKLQSRCPTDLEKLKSVGEKYLVKKLAGFESFEKEAQMFHLALCYYCPIRKELTEIEKIFGQGEEEGANKLIYFFGTESGGFRFEFLRSDGLVTHIYFDYF